MDTEQAHKDSVVLVTGAAGNLGRLLVQALHRNHSVVAVDRRPVHGLPKDVHQFQTDVRRRAFEDIFRKNRVRAILHLGLAHNPRAERNHYRFNVLGTERIL
ncbi:MAG: NAD-dependent epimerase/dehydratase family protein, partial [Myxococcota bacterium]